MSPNLDYPTQSDESDSPGDVQLKHNKLLKHIGGEKVAKQKTF